MTGYFLQLLHSSILRHLFLSFPPILLSSQHHLHCTLNLRRRYSATVNCNYLDLLLIVLPNQLSIYPTLWTVPSHILIANPFFTFKVPSSACFFSISPYRHLLPSSSQNKQKIPLLPSHEGTDRFMWSVWFCAVSYMFYHVKKLFPTKELHLWIP